MIVVNARFLTQSITGVQRFAIELSKQLINLFDFGEVQFVTPEGIIHEELAHILNAKIIGKLKGHLWEQIDLPVYLNKNDCPLLINLCSTAPIFYRNQIVTHHDITYIRYPRSFSKKFIFLYRVLIPAMLNNAKKIITVSNFSKREISEHYNVAESKIEVIYNGVNVKQFNIDNSYELPVALKGRKFLLGVSSKNFHKNFHGLIDSFRIIKNDYNNQNISLCIVGGSNSASFKNIKFDELNNKDGILMLGRVDDNTLCALYQHAEGFVFPSFYEGFGIPPLEAQACGCPVLASDVASIPEVLGDSVIYFNPEDVNNMAFKINQYLNNNELKLTLRNKGFKNVRKYTWEASAKKLKALSDDISPLV